MIITICRKNNNDNNKIFYNHNDINNSWVRILVL